MLRKFPDRMHDLFYSKNKKVSISSRLIAIIIISFTAYTVIPVIAEETSSEPAPPIADVAPTPASTIAPDLPTPEPTPEPTVTQIVVPTSEASPSESPTEEELKPELIDPQPFFAIRSPRSIAVDPRAGIALLPRLTIFGGSETGILCVNGAIFDIGAKNLANNDGVGELQIAGDFTSNLRISGSALAIQTLINSGNGLRVISTHGRLANSTITFSYAGLTLPSLDPGFCSQGSYRSQISFRALGLQMDNIKTRVDFNKP